MTELEGRGLPLTALAIAAGRAVETSRPDGLVADPFALALVEAARSHVDFPTSWPADPTAPSPLQRPLLLASIYIAVRTRFIDDFFRAGPPTPQSVLLGAGLESRWPRTCPFRDAGRSRRPALTLNSRPPGSLRACSPTSMPQPSSRC